MHVLYAWGARLLLVSYIIVLGECNTYGSSKHNLPVPQPVVVPPNPSRILRQSTEPPYPQ